MKKIYFFLSIIIFSNTQHVFSQLYVDTNTYIYNSGEVIYVNDNINLNNTDSFFYLRDEGQVIQGSGTTGNSGLGSLSVYQDGSVHNYAYNYWCSPVGEQSVSTGNQNFKVNLLHDVVDDTNSNAAGFTSGLDGTSSPLVISNRWLYTFFGGASYNDWIYVAETGNILPGLGFTMKGTSGSGSNQLYDFRGKPHNGTISFSILEDENILTGNPYPSALDALSFIHDAVNVTTINGVLYYWEQDLSVSSHNIADYVGGYATYTISAGGVSSFVPATFDTYDGAGNINVTGAASTSGKEAKRYIPIGQGFMVRGLASGTVRTRNAHRTFIKESEPDSQFFLKTNKKVNPSDSYDLPENFKRFKINIDFNDLYTRQLLLNFHDSATPGFDYGLEAKMSDVLATDAYVAYMNEPYTIQAHNFNLDLEIPLHLKLESESNIRIRIHGIEHFNTETNIYLYDKVDETYTNLRDENFETVLSSGITADRFKILFEQNTLSNPEFSNSNIIVYHNNDIKNIIIKNPNLLPITSVKLFNMLGKRILDLKYTSQLDEYSISTNTISAGIYIVNIVSEQGFLLNKKIIKLN